MEHIGQFITDNWLLFLALILILIAIFAYELITQKQQPQALSAQSVVALMNQENATLIDMRDKQAYLKGHIINSIHATEADFDLPRMEKLKNKPIILVCTKGIQTPALAAKLRAKAFNQVMILSGGINAWQEAALPLVKNKKTK